MARDNLGDVGMVVRFVMKMILNSVCWIQLTKNKIKQKKKVNGRLAGSLTLQLLSLMYPTPIVVVPSFISRGAIAPSGARALC
jgi:hypothetical protein